MGVAPEAVCNWNSWAQAQNNLLVILFVQPYYRQQVEGAEAFVRREQENQHLQAALDRMTHKSSSLLSYISLFCAMLLVETE